MNEFFGRVADDPSSLMFFLGIVLLTVVMMRLIIRRARRPSMDPMPLIASRQAGAMHGEMRELSRTLEVQTFDRLRDMGALLETRVLVLQQLLAEADAKIAELKAFCHDAAASQRYDDSNVDLAAVESAQTEVAGALDEDLNPLHADPPVAAEALTSPTDTSGDPATVEGPFVVRIEESKLSPLQLQRIELERRLSAATAARKEQTRPDRLVNLTHEFETIIKMADQGKTPVEIARSVHREVAEVRMILDVYGGAAPKLAADAESATPPQPTDAEESR